MKGSLDGRKYHGGISRFIEVQGEKGNFGSDFYVQKSAGHGNVSVDDGAIDIIGQGNYNGTDYTLAYENNIEPDLQVVFGLNQFGTSNFTGEEF